MITITTNSQQASKIKQNKVLKNSTIYFSSSFGWGGFKKNQIKRQNNIKNFVNADYDFEVFRMLKLCNSGKYIMFSPSNDIGIKI